MRAIVLTRTGAAPRAELTDFSEAQLMPGEVTIGVSHSTLNYKDGLAICRGAPVVRRWPMIPGIDAAGVVLASDSSEWAVGDAVIVNGWGMGEAHLGGYAERIRVPTGWPVRLPNGMVPAEAMAVGTAGYTAMLAVMALERHGLAPADGAVLVTGAAGGVGSIAVAVLSRLGWRVIASTGRTSETDYLRALGATEVIDRAELATPPRPLMPERWAAAIDSVGSVPLAHVLAATRAGGAVAACGLAAGMDLPASVAPFILRGVSLLGVDSVMCPRARRVEAWGRIARELDRALLARMTTTIALADVIAHAPRILAGEIRGRVVVGVAP